MPDSRIASDSATTVGNMDVAPCTRAALVEDPKSGTDSDNTMHCIRSKPDGQTLRGADYKAIFLNLRLEPLSAERAQAGY